MPPPAPSPLFVEEAKALFDRISINMSQYLYIIVIFLHKRPLENLAVLTNYQCIDIHFCCYFLTIQRFLLKKRLIYALYGVYKNLTNQFALNIMTTALVKIDLRRAAVVFPGHPAAGKRRLSCGLASGVERARAHRP